MNQIEYYIVLGVSVYLVGAMITLFGVAYGMRSKFQNGWNYASGDDQAGLVITTLLWPIIGAFLLIFTIPIVLIVLLVKFLFHVAVHGDPPARMKAIFGRIRR